MEKQSEKATCVLGAPEMSVAAGCCGGSFLSFSACIIAFPKPSYNCSLPLKMPLWMHWEALHKLLKVQLRKCRCSSVLSLLWALQIKFDSILLQWAGGRNQSVMENSEPDPINPKLSAGLSKSWVSEQRVLLDNSLPLGQNRWLVERTLS